MSIKLYAKNIIKKAEKQVKEFSTYQQAEGWLKGNGFTYDASTNKWMKGTIEARGPMPNKRGRQKMQYVIVILWD